MIKKIFSPGILLIFCVVSSGSTLKGMNFVFPLFPGLKFVNEGHYILKVFEEFGIKQNEMVMDVKQVLENQNKNHSESKGILRNITSLW